MGVGIKASGVPRSEIFLTTKLGNETHKAVLETLEASLKRLGTDYLDLCKYAHPSLRTQRFDVF